MQGDVVAQRAHRGVPRGRPHGVGPHRGGRGRAGPGVVAVRRGRGVHALALLRHAVPAGGRRARARWLVMSHLRAGRGGARNLCLRVLRAAVSAARRARRGDASGRRGAVDGVRFLQSTRTAVVCRRGERLHVRGGAGVRGAAEREDVLVIVLFEA